MVIETDGKEIVDDPKIKATLKVIDNERGVNRFGDAATDYEGNIGIEFRGSSSQIFPKKPFGIETWDADGNDMDASIFGWPEEEDWILHGPYSDKTLIRNISNNVILQFVQFSNFLL